MIDLISGALTEPAHPLLAERDAGGAWTLQSTGDVLARVQSIARALRARGLVAGDRVGLMSENRADWIVANLGILSAGCVTVPIYATQALDQVDYILKDSGAKFFFTDTAANHARLQAAGIVLPETVVFDGNGPGTLAGLTADGAALRGPAGGDDVRAFGAAVAASDLAVLIYTSGTTGTPKGVMLTHDNLASNATDAYSLVKDVVEPGDRVLSVLPFAHIYEHTNLFGYMIRNCTIYVNRQIEALLADMQSVRPMFMFGVPRIFERTYNAILTKSRAAGGLRAKLVPWAFTVGMTLKRAEAAGTPVAPGLRLQFLLAHALVLKKVRPQLGLDRLKFFGSGSAKLHEDIAFAFEAADIGIWEGYGLTECSPVVTVTTGAKRRIGTVGITIPRVEVKLGDDGELLVRGPNVMQGYYHDDEATRGVMIDGWFATGDIAQIDPDGFVRIVDRKKEIFKTSGGKYISPTRVESAILRSPYVTQVMVFGDGAAHPAALVSPNWLTLRAELNLPADATGETLAARDDVRAFMRTECVRETGDLASFEQIRWVGVLPRDLTIDADELTPTLKVKRRVVVARYGHLVAEHAMPIRA